ncbi:MAG TPA: hypothetical protein VMN35_08085 [Gaiellaceae bacterium]|nr:hypothetical protein [Gaiellaceae bacterium]
MKWIGFVTVPLLMVAFGVATYVATRPPERQLDAQGRTWVSRFEQWAEVRLRVLDDAIVRMEFGALARNARLVEPLRTCSSSFTRFGEPPELLEDVRQIALEGCGRAEHAVRLNDRFDTASLASIKLHLNAAERRLLLAGRTLRIALGEEAPPP